MRLKFCSMSGKQFRLRSDAAFCYVESGSTQFAQACLSQYLCNVNVNFFSSRFMNMMNEDVEALKIVNELIV